MPEHSLLIPVAASRVGLAVVTLAMARSSRVVLGGPAISSAAAGSMGAFVNIDGHELLAGQPMRSVAALLRRTWLLGVGAQGVSSALSIPTGDAEELIRAMIEEGYLGPMKGYLAPMEDGDHHEITPLGRSVGAAAIRVKRAVGERRLTMVLSEFRAVKDSAAWGWKVWEARLRGELLDPERTMVGEVLVLVELVSKRRSTLAEFSSPRIVRTALAWASAREDGSVFSGVHFNRLRRSGKWDLMVMGCAVGTASQAPRGPVIFDPRCPPAAAGYSVRITAPVSPDHGLQARRLVAQHQPPRPVL